MASLTQNDEGRVSLDFRPAKKPRACLHCHIRKVRCNAWEVGIPCTRCKRRNQGSTCVLANGSHRAIASALKYKRRRPTQPSEPTDALPAGFDNGASLGADSVIASNNPAAPLQTIEPRAFQTPTQPSHLGQSQGEPSPDHLASTLQPATTLAEQMHDRDSRLVTFPIENDQEEASRGGADAPTREEDVHFRICQEMSRGRARAMSPSPPAQNLNRREVIELHEGINSMTILGEVLGQQPLSRFVRVVVANDGLKVPVHQQFPGLDEADMAYLEAKGALNFPPPRVCDELLRLYFSCVYPYAPILDRVKLLQDYRANQHSPFLLQSILANAVPHAPKELLQEAGYKDRITAQQSIFSKARLLYDTGCEKSQLHLLQGSIMLSSLSFSYAMDKDYRYWLSNAGRIATQMGLHRNYVSEALGTRTKRLFRRIWWVLYNRDTLLTISGIDNLRRFNDRYCDTTPLTEADWDEEVEVPEEFRDFLQPIPRLQRVFLVEYSKLSVISGMFIQNFKTPGEIPDEEEIALLSDQICSWKTQLPIELQIGTLLEWSSDNIWVLVLLAMGFRLEAVFCRAVKEHYRNKKESASVQRIAQRQENAMFELSTIIQRASIHEVLHLCPLSFMTCASTILAMRIEIALDPTISPRKLLATKTQIFAELEYLRESCEYWSSLIWTVRMFEAVIARTRLGLAPASPNETKDGNSETPSTSAQGELQSRNKDVQGEQFNTWDNEIFTVSTDGDLNMSMVDDVFGILPVTDNYDWLQNLFGGDCADDFINPVNSVL